MSFIQSSERMPTITVKASNFGHHGNFGPTFEISAASLDESCTRNEQNQIFRSEVFLELLTSSYFQ
jgi:hypothetical protein